MTGQRRPSFCDGTRPDRVTTVATGTHKVVILGISNDAPLIYRRPVAVLSIRARSTIHRNGRAVTPARLKSPTTRVSNICCHRNGYIGHFWLLKWCPAPLSQTCGRYRYPSKTKDTSKWPGGHPSLFALPFFSEPPHFVLPEACLRKMDAAA